ncbi:DUF4007 family protein [Haloferula sp. A504]|uniref:DUF4007 family protein n=1 Tax=Haloferula sp. A504 TaxID=3373601 RepID=UPI0031CB4594|nr:DUF4007 family protein [Verrucomicrobiaceae bacterium E54]
MPTATAPQRRFTGHETFVCRYAWLPKVVRELDPDRSGNPLLFKDEDDAMVRLGVGKNMVRSAKFWAECTGIIEEIEGGGHGPTEFGRLILGHDGYDEFLQRIETLWLLHWKLATNPKRPLFHWQQMLNHWQRAEFSESEVLPFLIRGLRTDETVKSERTFADGFRVFVNSYLPTRGRKGEIAEDNLDCPLVELGLLQKVGERLKDANTREPVYSFVVDRKPGISSALFAYCIWDYWRNSPYDGQSSLGFRFVSSAEGSPGQIFKLPELAVRPLLDGLSSATDGAFAFVESSSMQQVEMKSGLTEEDLLRFIYTPADS